MPGSEDMIRLLDVPQNKADVDAAIADLKRLDEAAKGISGISIFGKTGNASEARAQQQQMAAGMEQIAQLQQKMIELENQLQATRAKGGGSTKAKTDEELRAQIELSEAQRQRVASIKDQVKYNQAETDSIVRKRIELKQLQAVYDKLSQTKGDVTALESAKNQVKALNDELLDLEGKSGRFGRAVGSYSIALKPLEEEFKKVSAAMANMEAKGANVQNFGARTVIGGFGANQHQNSGPTALAGGSGLNVSILNEDAAAYQKLGEQAGWLNTIIQKNEMGFSSVTQAVRASERALVSMKSAGMEGTEAFAALREETTETAREMKEFQRQQKLLESELPGLKALTLAAKGLGGAYAIGAGGIALFAEGNEKIEKELNKMIAIMTILQGLQEAWELVNQAGAASMAFRATATNAAAAATAAYEFVVEGATAATIALNAALVASGIGAILVALGGMIYLLSKDTINVKELREAQQALNEQMKGYYEALVKSNEALEEELKKQDEAGKKLEDIQAINARSIQDQVSLGALKQANAEADKKRADAELSDLKEKFGANEELQGQYDEQIRRVGRLTGLNKDLAEKVQHAQEIGSKGVRLDGQHRSLEYVQDAIKSNTDLIKVYQGQADAIKVNLDRLKEVTNQQEEAEQLLRVLTAERAKFQHEVNERQIKALTEINNLLKTQAADYLALQTTSGGESPQIKALEAEKILRQQIISASMEQELRAEALTGNELLLIREKAGKEMDDLEVQFIGREAAIRYASSLEEINQENMTTAALLQMREKFYQQQEQKAKNAADAQKSYLEIQRDAQLQGALETHLKNDPLDRNKEGVRKYNELKLAIETEYNNRILQNDEDLNRKQISLNKVKIRDLEAATPGTPEQKQKQTSDINALGDQNNSLASKNQNIELQMAQNTANKKLGIAKDTAERQQEIIQKSVQYEQAAQDLVMSFVDAAAEREINRIDRQIKKNNELKEAETSRIQNSTLEETQKAANMERLQMQTDMRNQALQRKLNQTKAKEAEADRDAAVLKIFGNTLIDASAAGWITPAAIAIEVIGAAQIAALLAKTIPKYEIGTDYHPGGLMIVHPGEMRVDPSGQISMTPDQATYTYGEAGTKIIPRGKTDEMNAMLMAGIFADSKPIHDNRLQDKIDALNVTNQQMSRDIVAAIKKQKPAETHVHVDAGFLTYIKSCQ